MTAAALVDAVRGARVLVVDDDPFMRRLAARMLADLGLRVSVAESGRQAVDQLRIESFDCVLMDVQMPELDGLEATRLIRATALPFQPAVIAISGSGGEADRARCREAGMNDLILKPVARDDLAAALAACLGDAVRTEAFPASATPAPADDVPDRIDLGVLARFVNGEPSRLGRFVDLFVETVSQALLEMQAALQRGDMGTLSGLGHRLKSSARMVGALRLAASCEALEAMGGEGPVDATATALVQRIDAAARRVFVELREASPAGLQAVQGAPA